MNKQELPGVFLRIILIFLKPDFYILSIVLLPLSRGGSGTFLNINVSVLTNRCKCPEHKRQIVYKILGTLNLIYFRTYSKRQPSVFRDIDAGGNFASKLLEPLYNHHLAHNQPLSTIPIITSLVLNHSPATPHYSSITLFTTYSMPYTYATPYYSSLIVCPPPAFILSTYNFNCQRLM